jgi:hypothetical protein
MKRILIIAVTIVAVIALGNVLLVSAQGGTQPNQPNAACPISGYTCPFSGTMPYGGMMGGRGMMGGGMMGGNHAQMHSAMTLAPRCAGCSAGVGANGMHEQAWTAVAKKLGLTYAELNTAVQNGQTVAQLAQAKGVSLDALKTAALEAMKASFAELVKQGTMTQQQADWMLDRMDDMPMFNFDQGFGPGMTPALRSGEGTGVGGRGMMNGRGSGGMMQNWQQPTGPQG